MNRLLEIDLKFLKTENWRERAAEIGLLVATILMITIAMTTLHADFVKSLSFSSGEVAPYSIRAPRDFLLQDNLSTAKRRAEARKKTKRVFTVTSIDQGSVTQDLEVMLSGLESLGGGSSNRGAELRLNLEAKKSFELKFGIDLVGDEWGVILNREVWWPEIESSAVALVAPIRARGIILNKTSLIAALEEGGAVFQQADSVSEREIRAVDEVYSMNEAIETLEASFPSGGFGHGDAFDSLFKKLSRILLKPSVVFNVEETEERRRLAVDAVEPIYFRVLRGQVIVRAGDVVTPSQERKLSRLRELQGSSSVVGMWFGYVLISSTILLSVYVFLVNFWPGFRLQLRDLTLVSLILVGSFLLVKVTSYVSSFFPYADSASIVLLTPVAAGGLLLQVTLGASSVFLLVVTFGLLTGVFIENSGLMLLLIVLGNITGAVCIKHCSRRSAFLVAGVRIGLFNSLMVLGFALLYPQYGVGAVTLRVVLAFASGVLSGILGTGLAPVAEFLGGYITDIKLLELASLDRPLLRELSMQAPGTWNHSIVMGQMGEVAAESIGANSLLTRVGAYYHDIGKIKKPDYFVENQSGKENKHDKLQPSMSALIIKAHVKDGIEMAKQHRLPNALIDFIPEHHGSALIEFFYDKALKEAEDDEEVSESHYRYPGPKPQSKETGILMLADAIEASSRVLPDQSPTKIQGMVQKMINKVFASGQLSESNLTLKDLHLIARSFTRVLSGIYHRRVEYAEPVEKGKEVKSEKPSSEETNAAESVESGKPLEKPKEDVEGENNGGSRGAREGDGSKQTRESSSKKSAKKGSKEALKRLGM